MPTQFAALDTGFPTFTGEESTEQKVDALHNYTYMLLEYLRYVLLHEHPDESRGVHSGFMPPSIRIRSGTLVKLPY